MESVTCCRTFKMIFLEVTFHFCNVVMKSFGTFFITSGRKEKEALFLLMTQPVTNGFPPHPSAINMLKERRFVVKLYTMKCAEKYNIFKIVILKYVWTGLTQNHIQASVSYSKNILPDAEVQFNAAIEIKGGESDCSWNLLMVRVNHRNLSGTQEFLVAFHFSRISSMFALRGFHMLSGTCSPNVIKSGTISEDVVPQQEPFLVGIISKIQIRYFSFRNP